MADYLIERCVFDPRVSLLAQNSSPVAETSSSGIEFAPSDLC